MQHFLLIYDHQEHRLRDSRQFASDECLEATKAYEEAEAQHQGDENIEIVLIGADSIDIIKRTHGHYFDGTDRLAKYLTPAAS
ncbi:MAG: hypothetical protein WAM97_00605 [Acidimicrobiales bacterium]